MLVQIYILFSLVYLTTLKSQVYGLRETDLPWTLQKRNFNYADRLQEKINLSIRYTQLCRDNVPPEQVSSVE